MENTELSQQKLSNLRFLISGIVEDKSKIQSGLSDLILQSISPGIDSNETETLSSDAHLLLLFVNMLISCSDQTLLDCIDSISHKLEQAA
jgi:hypothetical protein